jgi:hypothetical protein
MDSDRNCIQNQIQDLPAKWGNLAFSLMFPQRYPRAVSAAEMLL